jgi:hypothetical protein
MVWGKQVHPCYIYPMQVLHQTNYPVFEIRHKFYPRWHSQYIGVNYNIFILARAKILKGFIWQGTKWIIYQFHYIFQMRKSGAHTVTFSDSLLSFPQGHYHNNLSWLSQWSDYPIPVDGHRNTRLVKSKCNTRDQLHFEEN